MAIERCSGCGHGFWAEERTQHNCPNPPPPGADHQHDHNRHVGTFEPRILLASDIEKPDLYAYACECDDVTWTLRRR